MVTAQTGRKLNNALTLTFKTSPEQTLATAVQAKSIGVLFRFRNGGAGRFSLSGEGSELAVDCRKERVTVTTASGEEIGAIVPEGDGAQITTAEGKLLAQVVGHPSDRKSDATWSYPLLDPDGSKLGEVTWIRTVGGSTGLADDIYDTLIGWEQTGTSLKAPSLGAHLVLHQHVDETLGDLLLATCVDVTIGCHSYVRP
jgi:hypothetical protein